MVRLRAGLIGSMRAWLPSRRSVDSHRGAVVMLLPGQVRSGQAHRAERGVPLAGHATRLLPDTAVGFLARHLIMGYVRLDRVLLGSHGKIRSCADRAAASGHANTPRRGWTSNGPRRGG